MDGLLSETFTAFTPNVLVVFGLFLPSYFVLSVFSLSLSFFLPFLGSNEFFLISFHFFPIHWFVNYTVCFYSFSGYFRNYNIKN